MRREKPVPTVGGRPGVGTIYFPVPLVLAALWGRTGYPYYGRAYTLALEPFTSPILPLTQCIEEGQAPVLRGGHTLASRLEAGIFEVASGIKRLDFDGSITVATS